MDAATQPTPPTLAFAPDSPWGRCLTHFLDTLYHRSQSRDSVRQYRSTLTHFFAFSSGEGPPKLPDACTREDVLAFLYRPCYGLRNRSKPPAPGTVNVRLAILSSFYTFASAYTYTGANGTLERLFDHANPTAGLHAGQSHLSYRAFSFAELERFFAVIPADSVQGKRDRALFLCYLWTARRLSEIAELRLGDLEQAVFLEHGQRREGWLYHFRNKGAKGVDDIAELPLQAKEAIDRYLEASGRLPAMTPQSPLFTAVGNRNPRQTALRQRVIWVLFKGYVRKAGLDHVRLTVHSLRHTAAQSRYAAGEDIQSIQHVLRHKNLATTYRYLHALLPTADSGAALLEERFRRFNM